MDAATKETDRLISLVEEAVALAATVVVAVAETARELEEAED